MDEVLEAIKGLESKFDTRLTALEEAAKAPKEEIKPEVEESAVVDVDAQVQEIAEAFVSSSLDAEGRSRVLAMHRATKKPIAELIEAEEAYVESHGGKKAHEVEGVEESAGEVEESAVEIVLPRAWKKKDTK